MGIFIKKKVCSILWLWGLGANFVIGLALAQSQTVEYPTKPVRVIVGSSPGGAPDLLARAVSQKLTLQMGQPFVVDNRAGASGAIGAEIMVKSLADGYTLYLASSMPITIFPHLKNNLPYNVLTDFAPIIELVSADNILVVNPALPFMSVKDLIQWAQIKPGSLHFGSAGNGSPAHLAGEMLNMMAHVHMTHVPYKGAAPALLDVLAGHIQFIITSPISAATHINSGKVRALATTGRNRIRSLPDLPTLAETLPGFESTQWWGFSAPAKTSTMVLERLNRQMAKVLETEEFKKNVNDQGAVVVGGTRKDFSNLIKTEYQRIGELIRHAGIKFEG
jgi:hypothetical protein